MTKTTTVLTSACTLALLGCINLALAGVASDTERLLDWAEGKYPNIFMTHQTTIAKGPWLYRNYDGLLAGVNLNDNNVYVFGGPWGFLAPTVIGPLPAMMVKVNAPTNTTQLCDAANLPANMSLTQNGNIITASTNDNCIIPPEDQNYCEFALPEEPQVTGISVLVSGTVNKMATTGLLITIPELVDELLQTGLDFKTCVVNAPSENMAQVTINTNVCYDLTSVFQAIPAFPGLTINPPVHQLIEASAVTSRVDDCFQTDATSVSDLASGDVWIKETDGTWTKLTETP